MSVAVHPGCSEVFICFLGLGS